MVVYTNRKGMEFMYILDYQVFSTLAFKLFRLSIYLVSKCLIFNAFTFTYYKSENQQISQQIGIFSRQCDIDRYNIIKSVHK